MSYLLFFNKIINPLVMLFDHYIFNRYFHALLIVSVTQSEDDLCNLLARKLLVTLMSITKQLEYGKFCG